MGSRRSRRERDASTQSAHVVERAAAALDGADAPSREVRTRRLSEGVLVEASIMARLLRWKVLTLDASLLLLPARPRRHTGETAPSNGSVGTRGRLSDAIRNIDAAEQDLARVRRG